MGHCGVMARASPRLATKGSFTDSYLTDVQCGPDEWYVCVEVRELAVLRDGRRAPRGTSSRDLYYPCCFRDSSEIRSRTPSGAAVTGQAPEQPGQRGPG
jgi:hypothetical protein